MGEMGPGNCQPRTWGVTAPGTHGRIEHPTRAQTARETVTLVTTGQA